MSDFPNIKLVLLALDKEYEAAKKAGNYRILYEVSTALNHIAEVVKIYDEPFTPAEITGSIPSWKELIEKTRKEVDEFNHKKCTIKNTTTELCHAYDNGECRNQWQCDPAREFNVPDQNVAEFILGKGLAAFAVFKNPNSAEAKDILEQMKHQIKKRGFELDEEDFFRRLNENYKKD
jgi:hypothetical protein